MKWNSGDHHTSDSRISFARSLISCDGFMFSGSSSSCSNRACAKAGRHTATHGRGSAPQERRGKKLKRWNFFPPQVSKFENKAEISRLKSKFREQSWRKQDETSWIKIKMLQLNVNVKQVNVWRIKLKGSACESSGELLLGPLPDGKMLPFLTQFWLYLQNFYFKLEMKTGINISFL